LDDERESLTDDVALIVMVVRDYLDRDIEDQFNGRMGISDLLNEV